MIEGKQVMVANLTPIGEGLDQILVWQLLRSGSSKVWTVIEECSLALRVVLKAIRIRMFLTWIQ